MASEIALKERVRKSAERQFDAYLKSITEKELEDLLDLLRSNMLAATIEKVKRIGTSM